MAEIPEFKSAEEWNAWMRTRKDPAPKTPAEEMQELERSALESATRHGWGKLLGRSVLGDQIVWTFEKATITARMPVGSQLDR
jgi:hypothetical protein